MESRTKLEEIGKSRILSDPQRRWLDGDKSAMENTPERQIWYKIRVRLGSAYAEIQFINERMPPEQFEKIGKSVDNPLPPSIRPIDTKAGPALHGTARALAASVGMDSWAESLEDPRVRSDYAEFMASRLEDLFEEAGYEEDEYAARWSEIAMEILANLKD